MPGLSFEAIGNNSGYAAEFRIFLWRGRINVRIGCNILLPNYTDFMIEVKFLCPHCGSKILVDETTFGLQINCPHCDKAMVAPIGRHAKEAPPLANIESQVQVDLEALNQKHQNLQQSLEARQRQSDLIDRQLQENEARLSLSSEALQRTEHRLRGVSLSLEEKQRQLKEFELTLTSTEDRILDSLKQLKDKETRSESLTQSIANKVKQVAEQQSRLDAITLQTSTAQVQLQQIKEALNAATHNLKTCEREYFLTYVKPHLPPALLQHATEYAQQLSDALSTSATPDALVADKAISLPTACCTAPPSTSEDFVSGPESLPGKRDNVNSATMKCPFCKETIREGASKCIFCAEVLDPGPALAPPSKPADQAPPHKSRPLASTDEESFPAQPSQTESCTPHTPSRGVMGSSLPHSIHTNREPHPQDETTAMTQFSFAELDLGAKIIFVSAVAAILSLFLPWIEMGIINVSGWNHRGYLFLLPFIYPVIAVVKIKGFNKMAAIICGTVAFIAAVYYIADKNYDMLGTKGNASGSGLFLFAASTIGLIVGSAKCKRQPCPLQSAHKDL